MFVNGCDCSIVIKTTHCEKDIPFSNETIREAVSILEEEASIEGDGMRRAIRKSCGVTGCVVTPLSIGTFQLLLYLAMGSAGKPVYVANTKDIYKYGLDLTPMENSDCFDLVQYRGNNRLFYEQCRVKGFELRIMRDEYIKLKLDVFGEFPAVVLTQSQPSKMNGTVKGTHFLGENVKYQINGEECKNIYGITLVSKKEGGTKTEIWVKRALNGNELPAVVEELLITAQLANTAFGLFRISLRRLVLVSDETEVNTADTVIGPIRYYVAGGVNAAVFTSGEVIQ